MGSKDNMVPKNAVWASSFLVFPEPFMDVQSADAKNVGLMNSWWKMSRNDEDCWDSWHSLDSPHIVNILTVLSSAASTHHQYEVPRNSTHQWANLPVKPNYRSHRLWVSCPLGENATRLRQVTRRFCARILTHNLQTTNCLSLMSRTLSSDELILLLSVSGSVAQELSP